MAFFLWLLLCGVALPMSGKEYEARLTALTVAVGAMMVFWAHRSKLVPSLVPPDSRARHRPRPRPMSESAPQPNQLPEKPRFMAEAPVEPRAPIEMPPEEAPRKLPVPGPRPDMKDTEELDYETQPLEPDEAPDPERDYQTRKLEPEDSPEP